MPLSRLHSPRRVLAVAVALLTVGLGLAAAQTATANATTVAQIDAQACPAPLGGRYADITGNPVDSALVALGVKCAWLQALPGQVGQSSGVAVTVNGVPAVAVGDKKGTVRAYSLADGHQVLSVATGASRIDGALSVSADGTKLYSPLTSVKKGAPELAAISTTNGAIVAQAHPCGAKKGCIQLSGVSVAAGQTLTGGVQQSVYGMSAGLTSAWSYLNSDSTNSTAASADLYGTGQRIAIFTNDQTPNKKVNALSGGHLRLFTPQGKQICNGNVGPGPLRAPGSFDSSPAVANFGGTPTIVFGTGESGYAPTKLLAYNSSCQKLWTSTAGLSGKTIGSPTIADVSNDGDGVPEIIETTFTSTTAATVYVIDGKSGNIKTSLPITLPEVDGHIKPEFGGMARTLHGPISCVGSAGTSSQSSTFTLDGKQYIVAPAGECGAVLLQIRGGVLTNLGALQVPGAFCAIQNTPVVTAEGTNVGITIAGYQSTGSGSQGCVEHFTIPSASATPVVLGAQDWPEFHHDAQLTGALDVTLPPAGHRDTMITGQTLVPGQALYSSNGTFMLGWLPDNVTLARTNLATGVAKPILKGAVTSLMLGTTKVTAVVDGKPKTLFVYKATHPEVRKHETDWMRTSFVHLTMQNDGQVMFQSAHSVRWWNDQKFYELVSKKTFPIQKKK